MRHAKEETPASTIDQTDISSVVDELSGFSSKEISKLLKDSENFTIQCNIERGSLMQVDVERLSTSLPLHLIAVLLSPKVGERLEHLLRGVRLLHTLSDVASRNTRLEQILLDDVKLSEQLMDLVFFMLIILAQTEQEHGLGTSIPTLHSALVPCTLHLLTGYISSQWQELVHILLVHPKVDIFMDVAFDAVHADIRLLHIKLSALDNDILCKSSSLSAAERIAKYLCQQCEASLQFLLSLCQQRLYRDRLLKNKELCTNGGILSLCRTVLKLKVLDSLKESFSIVAAVSRLKAKVLSILLQLCEAESISYLDEVAGSPNSMHLAKSVALEILDLLKAAFRKELKQLGDPLDRSNPKGLLLLNSLRLADIYSDDSNFRSFFMISAIEVLIEILAIPVEEFQSIWCSIDVPLLEEDANVEYDPFTAAGVALIFISPDRESALSASASLSETSSGCFSNHNGMTSATYAQQRTSYLVKIIANLHCFVPNICEEEERYLFLKKFHKCLLSEAPESSKYPSNTKAQKTATICENLSSLSGYASSLVPNLLNDEDVHLFRVFTEQLKKVLLPQIGDIPIQELSIKDDGTANKVEDLSPVNQSLRNSTSFPSSNFSKLHQDNQNTWGGAQSVSGNFDGSIQEAANVKENYIGIGGIPESSIRWEVAPRIGTSKPVELPHDSEIDQNRRKSIIATTKRPAESCSGIEKESQNFEAKEYVKDSSFQDDEKVECVQGEEKQPRKRKRNIMSEKQINMIEKVLVDEPEMQRNAAMLQLWADKLSAQGSEITPSQLKNWLNNRKARLARIAAATRETRAPSEGENAYPEKTSAPNTSHFYDSPDSTNEEPYAQSTRARSQSVPKSGRPSGAEDHEVVPHSDSTNFPSQQNYQMNRCSRAVALKSGQPVLIVDGEGKEVGMGKVFQAEGWWQGKSLEEVGVCIVDVTELKVEGWKEVQYPSEGCGRTFEEAAARNGGVVRVAWDVTRLFQFSQ